MSASFSSALSSSVLLTFTFASVLFMRSISFWASSAAFCSSSKLLFVVITSSCTGCGSKLCPQLAKSACTCASTCFTCLCASWLALTVLLIASSMAGLNSSISLLVAFVASCTALVIELTSLLYCSVYASPCKPASCLLPSLAISITPSHRASFALCMLVLAFLTAFATCIVTPSGSFSCTISMVL